MSTNRPTPPAIVLALVSRDYAAAPIGSDRELPLAADTQAALAAAHLEVRVAAASDGGELLGQFVIRGDGHPSTMDLEPVRVRLPAHRPRRDPTATRVNLVCRVHPSTRQRLDSERARTGEGLGELLDRLAANLTP